MLLILLRYLFLYFCKSIFPSDLIPATCQVPNKGNNPTVQQKIVHKGPSIRSYGSTFQRDHPSKKYVYQWVLKRVEFSWLLFMLCKWIYSELSSFCTVVCTCSVTYILIYIEAARLALYLKVQTTALIYSHARTSS